MEHTSKRWLLVVAAAVTLTACGGGGGGGLPPGVSIGVSDSTDAASSTTAAPDSTVSSETVAPTSTVAALPPVTLIDLPAPGALGGAADEFVKPVAEIIAGNTFEAPMWAIKDSQVYEIRRSAAPNYTDSDQHTIIDKIAAVTGPGGTDEDVLHTVTADISAAVGLHVSDPVTEIRDDASVTYAVIGDYGTDVLITVAVSTLPGTGFHTVSIERQTNVPGATTPPADPFAELLPVGGNVPLVVPGTTITGWDFEDGLNMFSGVPQHSRSVTYRTDVDYDSVMYFVAALRPDWKITDDGNFGYLDSPDNSISITVAPSGDAGVNITVAATG